MVGGHRPTNARGLKSETYAEKDKSALLLVIEKSIIAFPISVLNLYFQLVLFFSITLHNVSVLVLCNSVHVLHKLLNLKSQPRNHFGLCLSGEAQSLSISVALLAVSDLLSSTWFYFEGEAQSLSISVALLAISDLLSSMALLLLPSSSGHLYHRSASWLLIVSILFSCQRR
ncbi:hypothetical protein K1719_017779 [Acacia pycnantha]|nr:hypothetical protein K1719_017779 [Acacia pycnantha]